MSQGTGKGERRERRKEIREGKSSVRGSQQRRKRGHKGRGKDGGRGGRERRGDVPTILSQCETAFFTLIPVFEDN